ncbi:MAG: LysM peptidoglycan-binding domain-containing M23 family metallopeptidase [bacterium]|nr:LysM peptidoglycan-binding domain-containing M23 family metallopeptidase [bacterium]
MDVTLGTIRSISVLTMFLTFTGCSTITSYCQHIKDKHGVYHVVQPGQTLWRIAKVYEVPLEDIAEANNIQDVTYIKTGERIFIPGATQVLHVEPFKPDSEMSSDFIWPVMGEIISHFGMRNGTLHRGIDISSPSGAEIRSAKAGKVVYSQYMKGFGNVIIIDHKDGFTTVYAHNLINLVKQDDEVEQGEVIGNVGSTGNATSPHLHFEIRKDGVSLDPLHYLPKENEKNN